MIENPAIAFLAGRGSVGLIAALRTNPNAGAGEIPVASRRKLA